jgi:hypothetical protein
MGASNSKISKILDAVNEMKDDVNEMKDDRHT